MATILYCRHDKEEREQIVLLDADVDERDTDVAEHCPSGFKFMGMVKEVAIPDSWPLGWHFDKIYE